MMINDNPHEFLEHLAYGGENEFLFRGRRLIVESHYLPDVRCYEIALFQIEPTTEDTPLFQYQGESMEECLEQFLKAPLLDGLAFWEAEHDIEWLYGY